MIIEAIVIAGNYGQYEDYIKKHQLDPRTHLYIGREEQLFGLHGVKVLKVGEYWKSPVFRSDRLMDLEKESK